MIRDTTGLVHTVLAFAALLLGSLIFLRPKGGTPHRWLGYAYAICMLGVIATSFTMFRLTGRFNGLHGAAIASAITVGFGLLHAISRKPAGLWYDFHYHWMSWSFIGLSAALVAELATRVAMPLVVARFGRTSLTPFWCIVGAATLLIVIVGAVFVVKHRPRRAVTPP
jgi:uncharacterized membrane protein